jgi:hypothetical protein
VHLHEAAHTLGLACARVVERVALVDRALIDAVEKELAYEGVRSELEREADELLVVAGIDLDGLAIVAMAYRRRNVERAGKVVDDAVENLLDALVLEGRAGDDATK